MTGSRPDANRRRAPKDEVAAIFCDINHSTLAFEMLAVY